MTTVIETSNGWAVSATVTCSSRSTPCCICTTFESVEYQRHDAKSEAWPTVTVNRMTSSTTKQHECA
jgi:hypothetical protein